jgi:hypothetical protein
VRIGPMTLDESIPCAAVIQIVVSLLLCWVVSTAGASSERAKQFQAPRLGRKLETMVQLMDEFDSP